MTLITLLLINISVVLLVSTVYLYRQLQSFKASLASFKPVEVQIGARIAVTKDEEMQLSKNKEALKILSKLCEQYVSLQLSNIDNKRISMDDFRYTQ